MKQVVWHGNQQESFDLMEAAKRNCECAYGLMGVRLSTCAAHDMMISDQRAMDGLIFARRALAERMLAQELAPVELRGDVELSEPPSAEAPASGTHRPTSVAPFPFTERQFARLLIVRGRHNAGTYDLDGSRVTDG